MSTIKIGTELGIELKEINIKKCNICFEDFDSKLISNCSNCIESGNNCHDCNIKWAKQKKDPKICSICKEKTKENVNQEAITIFENNTNNNQSIQYNNNNNRMNRNIDDIETGINENRNRNNSIPSNNEEEIDINDFNSCSKFLCWIMICLIMSWLFAAFSFFVIFRIKKNLFYNIHIAIGCGSVIGIPLVIIFRKQFKKNCIPSNNN